MPMTYTSLKTDIQTWAENTGTDFTNQLDTFIDNTQQKLSDDLQAALKAANRKTKLYKIGTYVGAGALLLLLAR